jgi:acetyl-CoA synthase
MGFASAFEGEIIRKADTHAEFSSGSNPTCELVIMRDMDEIDDHAIIVDGSDIDGEAIVELPIGILVEVAGAKMQIDFEPVIERKIHHWCNYVEGVMHTGQRNLLRLRVSKEAYSRGLRLRDFGEVFYKSVMDEFGTVVDKCKVTIFTDKAKVQKLLEEQAMPRYKTRDERLENMTDESVDTLYTCILCQSFAPAHVCIVTPERLGLCGAVSWLDAKATKELTPHGPCQPIEKRDLVDERTGSYTEVDRITKEASRGAVERVTLYSLIEDPMTSCGCFECISGIMPEANGVIVVNREYKGMTPSGMTFGELASMTGGGVQTPGFMGHGRHFIASRKFISAEGGIGRIVWMPKELKDDVCDRLNKTAKELCNIDNFADMICDETIATESNAVLEFLESKNHPALRMNELV